MAAIFTPGLKVTEHGMVHKDRRLPLEGEVTVQVGDIVDPPCDGDTNNDGEVNVVDLLAVISAWGDCSGCPEDFNDNGSVDVTDLLLVISAAAAPWCPSEKLAAW